MSVGHIWPNVSGPNVSGPNVSGPNFSRPNVSRPTVFRPEVAEPSKNEKKMQKRLGLITDAHHLIIFGSPTFGPKTFRLPTLGRHNRKLDLPTG